MITFRVLVVLMSSCFAFGTCQSTFTAKQLVQISWCVNENGEIEQLGFPDNYNQVIAEGYALCTPSAEYWSVGGIGSGNWQTSVITQPKGPNTLPLTISRSSVDGQVTITQTFSRPSSFKAIGIKMNVSRGGGTLIRHVELDPSQSQSNHTSSSAFGWASGFIGTLMKPNNTLASSFVTLGGVRNLCSGSPTNGNQALGIRWSVGVQKWVPYVEYSGLR